MRDDGEFGNQRFGAKISQSLTVDEFGAESREGPLVVFVRVLFKKIHADDGPYDAVPQELQALVLLFLERQATFWVVLVPFHLILILADAIRLVYHGRPVQIQVARHKAMKTKLFENGNQVAFLNDAIQWAIKTFIVVRMSF
jgi:hypothetical protein